MEIKKIHHNLFTGCLGNQKVLLNFAEKIKERKDMQDLLLFNKLVISGSAISSSFLLYLLYA